MQHDEYDAVNEPWPSPYDDAAQETDSTINVGADDTEAVSGIARRWRVHAARCAAKRATCAAQSRGWRMTRNLMKAVAGLATVLLAAPLTQFGWIDNQATKVPTGDGQYVALGSSFGAGPGIGDRAPGSPDRCIQSMQNYAHLLAARRHLNLTDVTCSGATAQNVLHGGLYHQPPQVDALRASTQLVTVTVGGNDISYLGNLIAWSCQHQPSKMPLIWRQIACTVTPEAKVDQALTTLPSTMNQIAAEVHQRSPHATLVFVDYATILPDTGSCPDRLPITAQELDRSRHLATSLAHITATAAHDNGAALVKASAPTQSHDICSSNPWVFGYTFPAAPFTYGPLAYHPTQQAMDHIADAINHTLG